MSEEILSLSTPIVNQKIFRQHTASIEYLLTKLIVDIHQADDSTLSQSIDEARYFVASCYQLLGHLIGHQENLINLEKQIRHFDSLPIKQEREEVEKWID